MSKVDLTSLEWCELIFKDRNKSYGAYKMRRDLGKRQAAALIIVTVVALVGFTLPRLIRMAMRLKRRNGRSDTAFHTGRAGNKRRNDEKGRTYRPSSSGS